MADLFPDSLPAGLPTISLWDPWGSLIAAGRKPYETRSWAPPARLIGQRIGIHVARRRVDMRQAGSDLVRICVETFGPGFGLHLPLGCVVATATLAGAYLCGRAYADGTRVDVRGALAGSPSLPDDLIVADALGDYAEGRWAWLLTDIERFPEPIPARGAQGFWTWRPAPDAQEVASPAAGLSKPASGYNPGAAGAGSAAA